MASTVRKPHSLHPANPRAVLKSKLTNDVSLRTNTRSSGQVISGMSPEARAAMLLTREDTKDNLSRARHNSLSRTNTNISIANKNKNASSNNNIRKLEPLAPITSNQHRLKPSAPSDSGSRELSKPAASTSDFNDSGFSSIRRHPLSAMTANTVTDADDKFEMDSNNNSSINVNNRQRRQHRPASRISRRQSASRRGNSLDGDNNNNGYGDEESIDDGFSPGRTLTNSNLSGPAQKDEICSASKKATTKDKAASKSFVLALDAALEANCISRLRGDITDQADGIGAAPGTVRALNGGRLSNAQEVVVNVCHGECEKELVFHDDDDDSLDTARAASEIRVNTWLEYNQDFPPDEIELDYDADTNLDLRPDTAAVQATKLAKTTLRVPTGRARSSVKQVSNKSQLAPISAVSGRRDSKPPVPSTSRRDSNNNNNSNNTTTATTNGSAGSVRSKSGTNTSQRDNSSSRFGSAQSNEGSSKRSANSSARKREPFLTRKART